MGKTKANKRKNRHKPTGLVSVQEAEKTRDEECDLGSKTLPILEKLNCLEDRKHACNALANLVFESNSIKPLMRHGIVRRVAPLMLDSDESIQETAAGILRNLTVAGPVTLALEMVEQDIMTPIIHYIKKFSETLIANSAECSEVIQKQMSVHEQVAHLLLNLCENTAKAVIALNDENIVPILVTFLSADLLPMSNILVTAQCLCAITEDNPAAGQSLVNNKNCLAILEKILLCDCDTEEMLLVKVNTAGSLFNICENLPSHSVFEMFQAIGRLFSKVLDYDIVQYVHNLSESCQKSLVQNAGQENGKLESENLTSLSGVELQKLHRLLEAQKTTLEILTNMCCTDEPTDEDLDGHSTDGHSSSDDMEENGACAIDCQSVSSHLSEEILTSVVSHELPKKVLQKCSYTKLNTVMSLSTELGSSCTKTMATIQTRALVCLNNMLSTIEVDHLGGPEAIKLLWTKIMEIAFQNNTIPSASSFSRSDDEFVEAASGALRSVLDKLAVTGCQCVTAEQANLLCFLYNLMPVEAGRVNLMNVLGIVGKMMITSSPDGTESLQCIGTVLRDAVDSDDSLWVIAEALDAIFDIFADSPMADVVAKNIGLLGTLEKAAVTLRKRMKKEKRKLGDRTPIVDTARTNLARFIKYKKQQNNATSD